MFTGIVEETGAVSAISSGTLSVSADIVLEDLKIGDSVAVNGVCLTVTALDADGFGADVMHETLNRSALGGLRPGSAVNLERAMPASGRFGGHIVTGHIDGLGRIIKTRRDGNAVWFRIKAEPGIMRYVVEKGSVAVDGISLTVAEVKDGAFSVSVIPHTMGATALAQKGEGAYVDLENDILAKYVEKLCGSAPGAGTGITRELLERYGF